MSVTPHAPPPGTILAGKYRVERVIGQGGMGVVVAAMHLQLDHLVAIKLLLPELANDREFLARFLREGRAAVKIRSEHVARVLDVGTLEDGAPFIVLEYLEGRDLGDLIAKGGALPIVRTVDLVLQACEALAEAHDLGIVHRDLKPSNFFLTSRPDETDCIKLLDFGISKVAETTGTLADHARTHTKTALGSPAYMSPEQLRSSRDVDLRTDIWALGISLHELLTGDLPFSGNSIAELTGAALHVPASPLRAKRPDAPAPLEAVVARCLAKDREERFPTIAALASALAPFGSASARASAERIAKIQRSSQRSLPDVTDAAPKAITGPNADMPFAATVHARTETAWNRSSRTASPTAPRAIVAAITGVVALGALVGGAILWTRRPAASPALPASAQATPPLAAASDALPTSLPAASAEAKVVSAPTSPSAIASGVASTTTDRAKLEPAKRPPRPSTSAPKPPPVLVAPGMATSRDGT